ncbi:DHH family phosphoesterase [Candidatus Woesearchaeota archaeon]|nr:DHH family phosphoesterase [Candidatus Woesearchaeota archaeon]
MMDKYEMFQQLLDAAAKEFKLVSRNEAIRVVSHLDADGLSSAAILIKALNHDGRRYSLSTVHQLDEEIIKQLLTEPYNCIFFTDLGSGQFRLIKKYLATKKVFILDHHQLEEECEAQNIVHVNPHLLGINGSTEVSGAGVTYLFSKSLNKANTNLAHIAIMGAIGDMQEDRGFERLNSQILEDAKKEGKMKVITGLRVFGAQTKPLHKVIEQSNEYPIPGVTGSESASLMFLQQLGITPRNGSGWKKLVDLTDDELQKLATAIILKRLDEEKPEEILGPVYILTQEKKESALRDAKEFSTLLNACGRLGKASIGVGACLGNEAIKEKAIKTLASYKREISNAMNWYKSTSSGVIKGRGYIIINAEENMMPTIIGTLASIISRSGEVEDGTLILSMAQMINGKTKVSLRIGGNGKHDANLREIMAKIAEPVEGQAGGHYNAAGALIDTDKEPEFIETAKRILEMKAMEERVV